MAERVRLALVWHMHQPSYRDVLTGRVPVPWTRLHVTKDYRDMVERLVRFPRVHATFNLTPVLLEQIEALAAGATDAYLDLARRPAEDLTPEECRFLARHFFSVHHARMLEGRPRYRELWQRCGEVRPGRPGPWAPLTPAEARDLQVWFHLSWVDPSYAATEPIRSLLAKGREFSEPEKHALLDWGVACAGATLPAYREAAARGQIELTTSAYHHPILPLLIDSDAPRAVSPTIALPAPSFRAPEDALEQLRRARASHAARFGAEPRGTWPPEGAVSPAALECVAGAGFSWAASDEAILAASDGTGTAGAPAVPLSPHRPYRVETARGPLAMVFRDRALSDLIGFTYMRWEPAAAAEDFVARVLAAGDGASEPPLVTVILDGENCWEFYAEDGAPFLDALYARLEGESRIEALTVSEALERDPPRATLGRVAVGSWIRADLGIWVGHPEKNRAWEELGRLRARLEEARARGTAAPEAIAAAWEDVLAAEASDWMWWYGDDHQSAEKDEYDRLFRSRLIRGYNRLGLPAPAAIRRSLRGSSGAPHGAEPPPLVRAVLDGRETDFFEWRCAQLFDVRARSGAAERASPIVQRVLFGVDETDLYLRVDLGAIAAGAPASLALRFVDPAGPTARIPLLGAPEGALSWADERPGDPGHYARGAVVELRVPFARLGAGPASAIRWEVAVERGGAALEVAPPEGAFLVETPGEDDAVRNWSAT